MTYVTRRKFVISSALAKKGEIENEVSKVKEKQEAEQVKLNAIKAEFDVVASSLGEVNEELQRVEKGAEEMGRALLDYVEKGREAITRTDKLLESYLEAVKVLEALIESQREELEKIKAYQQTIQRAISSEDGRLEKKRGDLVIYEKRLLKKIKEAGLEDVIKPVLP